ncbi:MAG: hypothetical protein EAZ57_04725 [Cytophagales bacterium]|nr:MAG: hypothetical protein EAZ67_01155 [Cytophagales bacterium]TAF61097.1 MAG: hypothetical protein EAZ57_04725 [Cytophagales bacterium]
MNDMSKYFFFSFSFSLFITSFILFSCNSSSTSSKESNDKLVAEVLEEKLYLSEIEQVIPINSSMEDSLSFANRYTNSWIKKHLLYQKASSEKVISEEELEKKLDAYKQQILIYELEKNFVLKNLDTVLKEEDIKSYYESNLDEFTLKQDVLKCLYIKLPKNASNISQLDKLMQASPIKNLDEFKSFCYTYSKQFSVGESYEPLESITNNSPFQKSSIAYNKNVMKSQDAEFDYRLKVLDYIAGGNPAPLNFVRDKIEHIILNKRKVELIKSFENKLFEDGKKDKLYQIY